MFGIPAGLHECFTVSDLYQFLGVDPETTGGFLYGDATKYRVFSVPKKSGGERERLLLQLKGLNTYKIK
ncbi:hypothetical protein JG654_16370 [Vibrio cholerae]|uniref:hypothetical protein n=1 Tax=Vibrio cholerae TaxID=666 RepID=UPI0018F08B0F|nr:hypothetical protein [Vibrio cholerae]EGQ9108335.1 hypothetical protein [Vibrio cholerae]MBJ6957928.1 hypothetical protein [Vibrio cholerae]MBJ6961916.1 hypothetical protein [Vibrio cholerae]MBY4642724.1 hypothetical protein [Vibrio cholerae]MCR9659179.1 hypothetical protein [Vibrio cholerae]